MKRILIAVLTLLSIWMCTNPWPCAAQRPDEYPAADVDVMKQNIDRLNELKRKERTRLRLLGPSTSEEPDISELIERADLYIQVEQNYSEALDDAEAVLDQEPSHVEARMMRVRALKGLGNLAESLNEIQGLLDDYPGDPYYTRQAALIAFQRGEYVSAASWAESLSRAYPYYENYLLLARCYRRMGSSHYTEASQAYTSSTTSLTPLVVYVENAELLEEMDDLDGAIAIYQSAIDRLRTNNIAHGSSAEMAEDSFPPEWRLRMAQLMKASGTGCEDYENHDSCSEPGMESCYWCQLEKTIETIDKLQAQTLPSAQLYALRSLAAMEIGQTLQSRSDALRAWKLYCKSQGLDNSSPGATGDILAFILGREYFELEDTSVVVSNNKWVTLNLDCAFNIHGDSQGEDSPINDGVFAPEGTFFNDTQYSLWFYLRSNCSETDNKAVIDLGKEYWVVRAVAQTICWNKYAIETSLDNSTWHGFFDAPSIDCGDAFLNTRDSGLLAPVRARYVRIYPSNNARYGWHSISEVQIYALQLP